MYKYNYFFRKYSRSWVFTPYLTSYIKKNKIWEGELSEITHTRWHAAIMALRDVHQEVESEGPLTKIKQIQGTNPHKRSIGCKGERGCTYHLSTQNKMFCKIPNNSSVNSKSKNKGKKREYITKGRIYFELSFLNFKFSGCSQRSRITH